MSIDVRNVPGQPVPTGLPNAKKPSEEKTPSAVEPRQIGSDSVNLTDTAHTLKKAEDAIHSASVVDSEKVADIARAIADGNYRIDAERVAEKLLQFEGELSK